MSSMRAPSGSRKYTETPLCTSCSTPASVEPLDQLLPARGLDADRHVVQPAEHLGVRADVEAGEVEEGEQVAVADVEEEVRGAGVVAVLDQLGQREAEHVLVEADGPLDVAADQRGVVQAAGGGGGRSPAGLRCAARMRSRSAAMAVRSGVLWVVLIAVSNLARGTVLPDCGPGLASRGPVQRLAPSLRGGEEDGVLSLAQRLLQVGDQVVDILDADRQPHEVGRHLERRAGDAGVRHPARVLDQRLDPAEGLGEGEQLGPLADPSAASSPPASRNDTIPPKPDICRAATSWPGCVGQPRVEHRDDRRGGRARNSATAAALAQCRSMRTARVRIPRSASQRRTGRRPRPSRSGGRPAARRARRRAVDQRAADDVGVAAEVLRGRVHHDVGAEGQRLLQVGRGERVVDDQQRAGLVGDRRRCAAMSAMFSSGLVGVSTRPAGWSAGSRRATRVEVGRGRPGCAPAPTRESTRETAGTCRRTRRRG